MSDFILIFRRDYTKAEAQPTPEQYQEHLTHWGQWYGSLAASDALARPAQRIDGQGRIVTKDGLNPGPYNEAGESVGGIVIIKVNDYDEAAKIAAGCPILEFGGNVEIRQGM